MINLEPERVMIGNGQSFGCVLMNDLLELLAQKVKKNSASFGNYMRMYVPPSVPLKQKENEPTKILTLVKHIQGMLSRDNAVIGQTGDSWFNCQKLELPEHCGFEFQMQYCSIRWAVGATLGYAQAAKDKRVILCIGDGASK